MDLRIGFPVSINFDLLRERFLVGHISSPKSLARAIRSEKRLVFICKGKLGIEFSEYIDGMHSCDGLTKFGHGLWVDPRAVSQAKIGDIDMDL